MQQDSKICWAIVGVSSRMCIVVGGTRVFVRVVRCVDMSVVLHIK